MSTKVKAAVGCALVAMGLLLPSAASALSKHTFSTSIAGSGAVALTNPVAVAVDQSTGDLYVANVPVNARQTITVNATGGTYTLTFKGQTTEPIAFDAPAQGEGSVEHALLALSTIGSGKAGGGVAVNGPPGGPYAVEFLSRGPINLLGDSQQPSIAADASGLAPGGSSVEVTVDRPGSSAADVEKFTPAGVFILIFGKQVNETQVQARRAQQAGSEPVSVTEAQEDLCTAASGDVCQPGSAGEQPGQFTAPAFLAVDNSGGLSSGDVYVANTAEEFEQNGQFVSKFDSSGHLIASWGAGGQINLPQFLSGRFGEPFPSRRFHDPTGLAVDHSGNLFVTAKSTGEYKGGSHLAELGQFGALTAAAGTIASGALAIDSNGDLLAVTGSGSVRALTPGGADFGALTGPGFTGPATAVAADLSNGQTYVLDAQTAIRHYDAACEPSLNECSPTDSFGEPGLGDATGLAVDESSRVVYTADPEGERVDLFAPTPFLPDVGAGAITHPTAGGATLTGKVDPAQAGEVTACEFEYLRQSKFEANGNGYFGASTAPCEPATHFAGIEDVHANISGLTSETTYHYRLRSSNANGTAFSRGRTFTPHFVVGLETEPPTDLTGVAATLNGSLIGDATPTHYSFEWGISKAYGHSTPEVDLGSPSGPDPATLEVTIEGLTPNTDYHYRAVAENGEGKVSSGEDQEFTTPPNAPTVSATSAREVRSETVVLAAQINPGGGDTVFHAEYGTVSCTANPDACTTTPLPGGHVGDGTAPAEATVPLANLSLGTTYRYRIVAENSSGTTRGAERIFSTLSFVKIESDPCPNAHVRQQTGAAALLDCRAYELVSSANAGGYDVESNLIEGQSPLPGYPQAEDRLLYSVHGGGIPGTNHPTDRGVDPYLATRGEEGWSTEYVGIPANATPSVTPFSSTLLEADAGLGTFVFGGPEICSPCFEGGYTGIPVHLPNGKLVQGMVASPEVPPPGPGAAADGHVAEDLSASGEHLIFGSTTLFAPGGNDETGDVSIYDHNLNTGETHVVSNQPGSKDFPVPLACLQGGGKCDSAEGDANGISELAISSDGSRVLLGQKVSEGAQGNAYYHLYMDVNDSVSSIDLTPGTTSGVLYAGMTANGSRVIFTTKDRLLPGEDTDESPDLYEAELSGPTATLHLISAGSEGTGNTDECDPVANSAYPHWNTINPEEANCGVVAIGGGGGVSSANGTAYFLSPERLDGSTNGTANAPNLYVAGPADDYTPRYITTLESALTAPSSPRLKHSFGHSFGSFAKATALGVDHENGYLYVLDSGTNTVQKLDTIGNPVSFTAGPGAGTNQLTGAETKAGSFAELDFGAFSPSSLAVDPASGDFYVPDIEHSVINKFKPTGELEKAFGKEGQVEVGNPSGVAVDPANGDLYATGLFGTVDAFDSSGNPVSQFPVTGFPGGIAVSQSGTLYVSQFEGETDIYDSSGQSKGVLDSNPSQSVGIDPSTGDVFVDEREAIARFESSGKRVETLGSGHLSSSQGVAIDPEGNLFATNSAGAEVALFPPSLAPDPRVDNPIVLDSVTAPTARHTADFQLTPDGRFAAFPSTLALAGGEEETAGHTVLYLYNSLTERLQCISCTPTGGPPSAAGASLASDGQSLTDDGRLFFTTAESLSAADSNGRRDAYEFSEPGAGTCQESSPSFIRSNGTCLALISAGTSTFDSGLLGVDASGKDAYFFTRDSLAPQDKNGPTLKIYDAREVGGFPYEPPAVACKASDECHGASSPAPPPLEFRTIAGSPANVGGEPKCKKGFVKKRRQCVHRHPHKHRHHKRAEHRRGGAK